MKDVYANGTLDLGTNCGRACRRHHGLLRRIIIRATKTSSIENAYWNGKITNPSPGFDPIAGNTVHERYPIPITPTRKVTKAAAQEQKGKPGSAFISGEIAYELDKDHDPRGTWTQGEDGPIFNKDGPAGIIFKVEVDREQTITWPDGTTADITTTVSSDLSEKAGLSDCDKVFVKNGEKVRTVVDKIPSPKIIKNSDGSTTTISYDCHDQG